MLLRNVGKILQDATALHPTRQKSYVDISITEHGPRFSLWYRGLIEFAKIRTTQKADWKISRRSTFFSRHWRRKGRSSRPLAPVFVM
jgi:hypothetical protein